MGRWRRAVPDQRDRSGGSGSRRIQRMSAIRQHQHEVHLGAQVDEVPRSLSALITKEAAFCIERDGGEKRDAGWDVSEAEPDLRRGAKEILVRVARGRAIGGER